MVPTTFISLAIATVPIVAVVAVVGAVATGAVGTLLSARSERRRHLVEQEMAIALGLPSEKPQQQVATQDDGSPSPSSDQHPGGDEPDANALENRANKQNYEQHVYVNFGEDRSASDLANLIKQQSDGHARLVIKYYAQGHLQASVSFALSMVFAVVGFVIIALALIQLLHDPQQPVPAGITGLVGIVNQAVSVLFFRRADKGRDLMMQLIDKLRNDRDAEMKFIAGLAAVEQVKSEGLRDALRASTVLTFTGSSVSLDQLVGLLSSGALDTSSTSGTPSINIFGPKADGHPKEPTDGLAT